MRNPGSSPINSQISSNAVTLTIYQQKSELKDHQICLEYQDINGNLQPPEIRLKLTNNSNDSLYCALLNLTKLYAINAIPFAEGSLGVWLEPKQEVWAFEGRFLPVSIPVYLCERGFNKYEDMLKLIVSKSEFDANLFEQENIGNSHNRSMNPIMEETISSNHHTFNKFMRQVQNRGIDPCVPEPIKSDNLDDWITSEVMITTSIPKRNNSHEADIKKSEDQDNCPQEEHRSANSIFLNYLILGLSVLLGFLVIFMVSQSGNKSQPKKVKSTEIILNTKN